MNVYKKLQEARYKLQNKDLTKSGHNKFAKYKYYELADFLPSIVEICNELGLFHKVSFDSELATLEIINIDKPEEVVTFTSPMASANLKGCHEVQNLGATQTYERRYLYMSAFEIVEHDPLDATTGKDDNNSNAPDIKKDDTISEATKKKIDKLIDKAHNKAGDGYTRKQTENIAYKDFAKKKGWKKFFIGSKTSEKAAQEFVEYMEKRLGGK